MTSYSYSASFAVALSSRPLLGIGRIWADGNLLRGAAGDLKTGGTIRFYSGRGDQTPDPLLAAAEAAPPGPAYRDIAYVVFEDLQLGDFGNRIPALSFEVFADEGDIRVEQLAADTFDAVLASAVAFPSVAGFIQEGSIAEALGQIQPIVPLFYDVTDTTIQVSGEEGGAPVSLREPTRAVKDDEFGAKSGFSLKRAGARDQIPGAVRYYDIDRDYQPSLQRASGAVKPGQLATVETPVALTAANARDLIEAATRRIDWSRQVVLWRSSEIDPAWRPGALVSIPGRPGIWRIASWEWRGSGLELSLVRTPFAAPPAGLSLPADTGRAATAADLAVGTTWLSAIELPWDGTGAGDVPLIRIAASSSATGWAGASLYLDEGDGQLDPIGTTGRNRSLVGTVALPLAAASPLIIDRANAITVELLGADMALQDATLRQMAMGANRAMVGAEIIQFGRATPLGGSLWKLEVLLRGRGGTEAFVSGHGPGERLVLLDDRLVSLDGAVTAPSLIATIKAIGRGDSAPVGSAIIGRGLTQRPLFPVHGHARSLPDGSLALNWTRRARAAWIWRDQVDTPLHEQSEAYEVLLGTDCDIIAMWVTAEPRLTIDAATIASLAAAHPGQSLIVRQRGSYANSATLHLTTLA